MPRQRFFAAEAECVDFTFYTRALLAANRSFQVTKDLMTSARKPCSTFRTLPSVTFLSRETNNNVPWRYPISRSEIGSEPRRTNLLPSKRLIPSETLLLCLSCLTVQLALVKNQRTLSRD